MILGLLVYIVSYKLISKLLRNRLREVLSKLISPLQSAFVPNRDIHGNILIIHEIYFQIWKKKKKNGYDNKAWYGKGV